jgi:hypothetical protein
MNANIFQLKKLVQSLPLFYEVKKNAEIFNHSILPPRHTAFFPSQLSYFVL